MNVHEYQGKEILRRYGVATPRGIPCFSVAEAEDASRQLGGRAWAVKAQIHVGGRDKGGGVSLYARADEGTPQGAVFIPFCYYEAAANLLTNPALDPFAKIPEFKYCAVRIRPGGQVGAHSSFGGGQLLAPAEA
jgi:hypothetical protein